MTGVRQLLHAAGDERGGVLLTTVVFLPLLIIFLALVVDVANWFEHKRHLQLQVDAGALAAGGLFNACWADDATGTAAMAAEARRYGGDTVTLGAGSVFNAQVTNAANVRVLVNSTDFFGRPGAGDFSDGTPCEKAYVDVRATELDLPWFFGLAPGAVVPRIDARARVSIRAASGIRGSLPFAIPAGNVRNIAAIFVDAVNDPTGASPLAVSPLARNGPPELLNGLTLERWDNVGTPASVAVGSTRTEVIVAVAERASWSLAGGVAAICAQTMVTCYSSTTSGLQLIHAPPAANPTATAIVVERALLDAGTCTDSSAPYFVVNAPCVPVFRARIRWTDGSGGWTYTPAAGAVVKLGFGGCPTTGSAPQGCVMEADPLAGEPGWWRIQSGTPSIPATGGAINAVINWQSTGSSGAKTTQVLARAYSEDGDTGPISWAHVSHRSVDQGTHLVEVGVGLRGRPELTTDAVLLRFTGGSGSTTWTLDCDPGYPNLRDEIENGCRPLYRINPGVPCDPPSTPLNCVKKEPGVSPGPLRQGMDARFIVGGVCAPNRYPTIEPGDRRIVPMMIVSYASFATPSGQLFPVVDYAAFYVTGWEGAGGACTGVNGPAPPGAGSGSVWGYFISYVDPNSGGVEGGDEDCSFSETGICITAMTD